MAGDAKLLSLSDVCKMLSKPESTVKRYARESLLPSVKEGSNLSNAGVGEMDGGQELNDTTLFGEYLAVYDVMINQYIHDKQLNLSVSETIIAMIEIGVHKMGHIKSLEQLCELG